MTTTDHQIGGLLKRVEGGERKNERQREQKPYDRKVSHFESITDVSTADSL